MRILPAALVLTLAFGGCASIRKGLGEYQAAADKGIQLGGPTAGAAPADTQSESRERRQSLPAGLGGDKANADYTAPQG